MIEPLVSVVIGSFNQTQKLKKVLNGFNHQDTQVKFEVCVVDSGSTDSTHEMLAEFKSNFIFNYFIVENRGKAAARNYGVSRSSSTIIIITDADMIPDTRFVQAHYEAHKNAGGPVIFQGCEYNLTHYHNPPLHTNLMPYVSPKPKNNSRLGWYYFLTGNISFSKNIFELESGFDESFKSYGWEDLELGYRLVYKKRVPLRYLEGAINYHYHVISKFDEINRCVKKGESAKRFMDKHPKLKHFLGKHLLSRLGYTINTACPAYIRILNKEGMVSRYKWLRQFSFWYLKEAAYWRGLYGT